MKTSLRIRILSGLFFLTSSISAQILTYTFDTGTEGWSGDFADYPPGQEVFYELDFAHDVLPSSVPQPDHGLRIQGNNHSDDLIMFVKKHITGLMPNTTYEVTFDLEVASNAPTNHVGVGGAPGEGVQFLAGATVVEPMKVVVGDFYRMNIDFGGQNNPGADTDTLGHVGVSDTTTVFTMIHRNTFSHPFTVTTDANGEVWVLVATDSGFEATTVLYYSTITIGFSSSMALPEPGPFQDLQWNIVDGMLHVRSPSPLRSLELVDVTGRMVNTWAMRGKEVSIALPEPNAIMLMRVSFQDGGQCVRKLPTLLH